MGGFTARRKVRHARRKLHEARTRHHEARGTHHEAKKKKKPGKLIMEGVAPPSTPKNKRSEIYYVDRAGDLRAKPMNRKGGKKGRVGRCHPGGR